MQGPPIREQQRRPWCNHERAGTARQCRFESRQRPRGVRIKARDVFEVGGNLVKTTRATGEQRPRLGNHGHAFAKAEISGGSHAKPRRAQNFDHRIVQCGERRIEICDHCWHVGLIQQAEQKEVIRSIGRGEDGEVRVPAQGDNTLAR